MVAISAGHMMSAFTHVLGEFASVTTTAATFFPSAQLVDITGKPTWRTQAHTGYDQVSFSGILKSVVVASFHLRAGVVLKPGAGHFMWFINGENGMIMMENDTPGGAFVNQYMPQIYLDGELVDVVVPDDELDNVGRAWAEFAKGEEGKYLRFEDTVKLRTLIDAKEKIAREGKTVGL